MTKQDIINEVRMELDVTAKEAKAVVEDVFKLLKTSLGNGINVEISDFGKFVVRQKSKRVGRNPMTGEEAEILSRKVITFKPSKLLREVVNRAE
jgi:integration host factor subunit alpha